MRQKGTRAALGRSRLRQRPISIEPLEPRRMLARLFDVDSDGDLESSITWRGTRTTMDTETSFHT